MGPTACGKTYLAIQLMQQFPIEVVSVDSAMVYRGMDIGTAKPDRKILQNFPHHLIDIREPWETYSAADFCQDANTIIEDILSRRKIPLLTGGTMLYFKALQQGLSELPSSDPDIRRQILEEASQKGWTAMHEKLSTIDLKAALRIHPNDPQRIGRALEVYAITGKTLTEHFEKPLKSDENHYQSIVLLPSDRKKLHKNIETRFHQMLSEGWADEVKTLLSDERITLESSCMRTVGYRQIGMYLQGKISYDRMISQGVAATRQLAKRQMTWLRPWPKAVFLDPYESDCLETLQAIIRDY